LALCEATICSAVIMRISKKGFKGTAPKLAGAVQLCCSAAWFEF
jgi:hypothetical protein